MVWSRNKTTGHTELKPIVQTFERQSATLLLTFSNGEKIETTKEHPFYVESEGFKAAGELGIGTSIVTRAGPSVTLASSEEKNQSQTVYNFEVEGFHTYFVGNSALWVHNTTCGGTFCYGPSAGGKLREFAGPDEKLLTDLPKPLELDWWEHSRRTLESILKSGGKVKFDLTYMENIPGVLSGSHFPDATTSKEIRYIRDNWNRFSGTVTFYKDGAIASPPWL